MFDFQITFQLFMHLKGVSIFKNLSNIIGFEEEKVLETPSVEYP